MQQSDESNGQRPDRVQRDVLFRAAVLAGDQSAWRGWMNDAWGPVCNYVRWRLGGDTHNVDETVQQTWLIAVRSVRRFDPARGSFVNWVRGIASNCIRKHLGAVAASNGVVRSISDIDGDTHNCTGRNNDRESLRIALTLERLSERHEAVLRWKYLDGYTVDEIAAQWNETPKAIESLLVRARDNFRKHYNEEGPSHE